MIKEILGSLSDNIFEQGMSTGSGAFSLLICLYVTRFVLLGVLILIEIINYPKNWAIPLPKNAKSPLAVDKRHILLCDITSSFS